ncbi:MAG: hypothetical protein KatS3mg057_1784 [Herpetosiphonaceae bacterium]|nr:MAG: hypothetical protein KatS3mg057_1784 [Herpetosiphonaceae bacterium]
MICQGWTSGAPGICHGSSAQWSVPSRHKLYLDAALSWRTLRVALSIRPTLIHAHLHEGALIGGTIARMLRVPLIFDYQGSLTAEMIDHGFLRADGPLYRPTAYVGAPYQPARRCCCYQFL